MKILHINTYSYGGAAKACLRLHSGLRKMDVDSKVLVLYHTPTDVSDVYDYKQLALHSFFQKLSFRIKESLRWRYLQYIMKGRKGGFDFFSTTHLYQNIKHLKIFKEADIIHLHWVSNFLNYDELIYWNKKIVWTLHDMNAFTGGCHYASGCEQFVKECVFCPQLEGTKNVSLVNTIFNAKKKAYSKKAITFITPSQWLLNTAKSSSLLHKKNIFTIPNGVDTAVFKPHPKDFARQLLGLPIEKKIILFVSESIENKRKGMDLLLEMFQKLLRELKQDILLCAVGKTGNINSESVFYFGEISDEKKLALIYSAADLFIIPSLEDNLPNTVLEAMACGVPVVGFNIGGIPDMINDNKNGFVVQNGDIDGMKDKILLLLNNKELLTKFGNEARQTILSKFLLEQQAKSYIEIYSQVLSEK